MCFIQFCTQLFYNYICSVRSLEHLSWWNRRRCFVSSLVCQAKCTHFCIRNIIRNVCEHAVFHRVYKTPYQNVLLRRIKSERISRTLTLVEPVWYFLVLKPKEHYLMAMSKIRSNLNMSVYEKWVCTLHSALSAVLCDLNELKWLCVRAAYNALYAFCVLHTTEYK